MELRLSEVYDGTPPCIAAARRAVRGFLNRVGSDRPAAARDDTVGRAQLVVSELVTNAVRYAGGACRLDLAYRGNGTDSLDITVWDASPESGTVQHRDPNRPSGHGLEIVHAICGALDIARTAHGKRVQVRMPVPTPG
ncbi:ATP-binding protein [Streptomyces sp. NPDC090306]|uniref:ATP-binding protein n=1 Tax=unclassified Streptomyces TaxID=2593676 RepID=UPI0036E67964